MIMFLVSLKKIPSDSEKGNGSNEETKKKKIAPEMRQLTGNEHLLLFKVRLDDKMPLLTRRDFFSSSVTKVTKISEKTCDIHVVF